MFTCFHFGAPQKFNYSGLNYTPPNKKYPAMFGKLQEDAARIDTEIATLESKLPEVMYGYTDRNPEPHPIVERRAHDNTRIQCEMQTFLAEVAAFEKLLDENSEETAEEERFVRQLAQERQLEHLLVQDDESGTDESAFASCAFNLFNMETLFMILDANLTVSLLDCPSSPNVDSDDRRGIYNIFDSQQINS